MFFVNLKLCTKHVEKFVSGQELNKMSSLINTVHEMLHSKTGPGSDFLGWMDFPQKMIDLSSDSSCSSGCCVQTVLSVAEEIKKNSDVLIVIGIGGSYLGARAVIEMLKSPLYNNLNKKTPDIYFAGTNISPSHLNSLLKICENKDVSVNVISKSGSTVEPGIAFRVFRNFMEQKYGKEGSKSRIYVTTDEHNGNLRKLAEQNNYKTFPIPADVGGRFSVLTAVGLLPIAVAGIDILQLLKGATAATNNFSNPILEKNDCYKYAALRNCLYHKGKHVELLVNYDHRFNMFAEWFKQLFGESEGKDQKGIFPSSATFSTDLHSLGQYIQDGSKILFETTIKVNSENNDLFIKSEPDDFDGLNFLSNKNMSFINQCAFEGTVCAHTEGGVPNIILELEKIDEFNAGYLIYFFEKACAISGYLLGVNPFDQPGVEFYKKNMINLLKSN